MIIQIVVSKYDERQKDKITIIGLKKKGEEINLKKKKLNVVR